MIAIERARAAAGAYLADRGYIREAGIVAAGEGDDFAEVRIAMALIARESGQLQRYEACLELYAEGFADGGEAASSTLAGLPLIMAGD